LADTGQYFGHEISHGFLPVPILFQPDQSLEGAANTRLAKGGIAKGLAVYPEMSSNSTSGSRA
jgi:hypothetical protein